MVDELKEKWFKNSIFYQIYPRSFFLEDYPSRSQHIQQVLRVDNYKANDMACGNLRGITKKLNYLNDLGIDAIWISPFYKSPMADFGYDVMDYTEVDPVFGTITDFKTLTTVAKNFDIKVVIDFVPNHSSSQHPWFIESRSSRNNPFRDFYYWRDPKPDGSPPNNWKSSIEIGPAWTFDEVTKQYYLHLFLPEQPDLNWYNPKVVEKMLEFLKFWLDLGTAGFRIDAIHCMGKDSALSDSPPQWEWAPRAMFNNDPSVHDLIRHFRRFKSNNYDYALIGEVFLPTVQAISDYYGNGDELDLCFIFPFALSGWSHSSWSQVISEVIELILNRGHWPAWTLSNHDLPRYVSRAGSEARARAAAVALLTLEGTPFIYQGEELGLSNARITKENQIDPGGRDGSRAPIPWTKEFPHGWPIKEPWLPFYDESATHNVETELSSESSTLNLYKALIKLRKSQPQLTQAPMELLETEKPLLAWCRKNQDNQLTTVINFSSKQVELPSYLKNHQIIFSSIGIDQTHSSDHILADEAIIIIT